jgi:DNA-directed RNA polymerase specialized sigma24 family protein
MILTDTEDWLAQATNPNCTMTQKHAVFDHLVKNYQDMAFGCAYAILGDFQCAEDAAQEAFLAAWQHLAQLKQPKAFPGWLRRIVVTQCHRQTRGGRLDTILLDDEGRALLCPITGPEFRELLFLLRYSVY